MRFFIALLAVTLAAADQGIVMRTVNTVKSYDFGSQYVAIAYELSVPRGDIFVSGVETTNVAGKTNDDVLGVHIVHQSTRYLPRRILDWFKNVIHYHVVASGVEYLEGAPLDARIRFIHLDDNRIKTVPKSFFAATGNMELISMERNLIETLDGELFRGMPKLRWVSFAGNRIRRLPGTLFTANPLLECISFENNGLAVVGAELVRGLTHLKGVSFDGNVCINIAYWNEPTMRDELTQEFTTNCGGKCDGVTKCINENDALADDIERLEEKRPRCSWLKNHWMVKDASENHHKHDSSSSSGSDESGEENAHKYGPNHACPHAHYPNNNNNMRN